MVCDVGKELRYDLASDHKLYRIGGSTIDATAYTVTSKSPKFELKEIKPSACMPSLLSSP